MPSRRTLKLVALGYVVKTVAFGVAWLMVPDLPERALSHARVAWAWVSGASPAAAPAASSAAALPR